MAKAYLTMYPGWQSGVERAARADLALKSAAIERTVHSAWRAESKWADADMEMQSGNTALISIGTHPYAHTHLHLIEFGGGYHSPHQPTRNSLRSIGLEIKWQTFTRSRHARTVNKMTAARKAATRQAKHVAGVAKLKALIK